MPCRVKIEIGAEKSQDRGGGHAGARGSPRRGRGRPEGAYSRLVRCQDSLEIAGSVARHVVPRIANPDLVAVKKCALIFRPAHITEFGLEERFVSPDKTEYEHSDRGAYYTDAVTGRILRVLSQRGDNSYCGSGLEEAFVEALKKGRPATAEIESAEITEAKPLDAKVGVEKAESAVRDHVAQINRRWTEWTQEVGDGQTETNHYFHFPRHASIACKTMTVYVPTLEIKFETRRFTYRKVVMMSTDHVVFDGLAECWHRPGGNRRRKACGEASKAVCSECGEAMCERHVTRDARGAYYCEAHSAGR